MASKITTKEIGKLLTEKYPGRNNDSIDYFWIMISKRDECFDQSRLNDIVEKCLMQSTQIKEWYKLNNTVQCGKHTMYFIKYIELEKQNERDRELALIGK